MKAKEIRSLLSFIASSNLDEVNIETDEFKISVKRNGTGGYQTSMPMALPIYEDEEEEVTTPAVAPVVSVSTPAPTPSTHTVAIKSPMIGTFYRSPSPDADSFVNIGDRIEKGQVVCIVEAMKLFNEIEAEISGTLVKVVADNASPVEYDQDLFLVEPD